ncbi:Putative uncharacterized protein [Taphrina deformans PYCC 5710]|uniref:Cytochrome b561 domain-containing protein n=1 Tax=Taphrina deformans (strain PYCC 5710 / ATCC 11124 / CBS 356.35 / IMI 108563 / JCM 9778 / NBRC 8474) TaxID=1097556 RepID=R4XBJ2_TAPDE|nr:Putative uncharacterized protein [Taphrina deformans PYCC 5710]|eukprot:CCG82960.1 Putative uncharacterized protein [Taphrina deformans PYCC 5710]
MMSHERYYKLVLAHAVVMSLAILWFIPIAIFAAKFFRRPANTKLEGSGKTWKTIHILSNVTATALIIAGFTLGYYASGNNFQVGVKNVHFIVGLTFFVGILVQALAGPVMTLYFAARKRTSRPLLNYVHITLGYLITLLGAANIWLGLQFYGSPHYLYGLWIAAVAAWLILYAVGIPLRKKYESRQQVYHEEAKVPRDSDHSSDGYRE